MEIVRQAIARRLLWPALIVGAFLGVGVRLILDVAFGAALRGGLVAPSLVSTAVANVLGTLILFGLTLRRHRARASGLPGMGEHAWLLWATGFCGSLTTYSALALAATHVSAGFALPPSWLDEATAPLPLMIAVAAGMGVVGASFRWQLNGWITVRLTSWQRRIALAAEGGSEAEVGSEEGRRSEEASRVWEAMANYRAAFVPVLGIAVINVLGSGLAGFAAGSSHVCLAQGGDPGLLALAWVLLGSGVLGAFTTFSTAVVDAWILGRRTSPMLAGLVFAGVWLLAWAACYAGWKIAGISACGAM